MEVMELNELYAIFCSAMSHCGTFLLNCNDEEIDYNIFEEFDGDCVSFLSDISLNSLLAGNYITKEIYNSAVELARLFRALESTSLWNTKAIKTNEKWLQVFLLADKINEQLVKNS